MSDDSIRELLRELSDADASVEAPPDVEVRLRKQFRSHHRKWNWRRTSVALLPVAATIVLIFVSVHWMPPTTPVARDVGAMQEQEVVTDFFPLVDPAPPFERGRLLRVEVPASAMQMVGLPVHEEHLADPVQADLLVGEEGLPRAIRFVKFERR